MNEAADRMTELERRMDRLEQQVSGFAANAPADAVSDADIRAAYRMFLGREPDAGGFDHYRERARNGLSFDDLVRGFTDCGEYRDRHAREIVTVAMGDLLLAVDPQESEFGAVIARTGMWEPHIVGVIRAGLAPGHVFVDIGANVGVMSFNAAQVVGERGQVIAFEPNPDNIQRFLQGVVLNGFANVTLYPFAASDRPATFSIQGDSNTYLVQASAGGRLTQAMRADDLLRGAERVDFIKMDIEGHEPHALAGLGDTIRRHRPVILCEFNPRCLSGNIGRDPDVFAREIFALTDRVEIVEHDGGLTAVESADALMALWHARDRELAAAGTLAGGMLHFDLLFRCR